MSAEVKNGYKLTEVGVIPDDWDVMTLGTVSEMSSGTTPSRSLMDRYYKNGSIAWVKTLDLNNSDICETDECVTDLALKETCLRVNPIGTVLVAMYGGFNQIGRTGLLRLPAAVNQAITAIHPFKGVLLSDYLIRNINYRIEYWKRVASSSRKDPNITSKDIRDFPVACPKLQEQESIADALSDADSLIESLEKLITKKRQIKQGAMQELLTGKKHLPGFSGKWEVKKLGNTGKCYRGVSYNPDNDLTAFDTNSTVRLLRSNNVQEGIVVFKDIQFVDSSRVSEMQKLRDNDILICMANGSKDLVGKAGRFFADDGYAYTFGAFMGCFRPNEQTTIPDYAFYLFQTYKYRTHISILLAGSSINNLRPSDIEAFIVPVSHSPEQIAIVEILIDMDAEIAALEIKLKKMRQIKQGMMHNLLTGNIRLV